MAGPWEKYQAAPEEVKAGPWAKYQKADFNNVQTHADTVSDAPAPTFGQRVGRELGLGARGMIQGVYDLSGSLGGDAVAHAEAKVRGIPYRSSHDAGSQLADSLSLPAPETGMERIGGDVTAALTGAGGWLGAGRALAMRAPGAIQSAGEALSSMPGSQVAAAVGGSGAAGVTRESGGSPTAQTVAGLVGSFTPAGMAGAQATVRGAFRGGEGARQAMQQNIDDFRSIGAQPSVGQATGNFRMQGVESTLAATPTSAGRMSRFAENQADDIGRGLQNKADNFMPNASAERAGRAVEKGAETFAGNIAATRKALYWQADKLIPEATRVPLTSTQRALSELTTPAVGAESTTAAMVNPKIAALAKNVGEDMFAAQVTKTGGLPYSAVKDIRSRIGKELSDFSLTTDKPTAEYKRLYAALSQDMEAAAKQQGPAAHQAVKRANGYFKASQNRLDQIEHVIDKNGGPEKVYSAVMSGTSDGGTTLRAVMQSLPEQGQKAVTAAVIKRMGKASAGAQDATGEVFSSQTFLTNWNKVSTEAKRALFDRHGPAFTKDMDRIARVAANIKAGSKVFANPSGTAAKGAALAYGGSLATATGAAAFGHPWPLAGLVAGGVSANLSARLMTNPRFVSWLAQSTKYPVSALPMQIMALKGAAERKDDPDLAEYAQALQDQQAANEGDSGSQ